MLELSIVKSNHGIFAYALSKEYRNYSHAAIDLRNYLFDGKVPEKTYRADWVKVDSVPQTIEKIIPGKTTVLHYKLKEGITPNEVTPAIVPYNFFNYEKDDLLSYYECVNEHEPEHKEGVEFKYNLYESYPNFKPISLSFTPTYDLMASIVTPPELSSEIPCKIGPALSFSIIREYIKKHIDGKHARLTSDYDFCLTATKVVPLVKAEEYTYFNLGNTKRGKMIEKKGLRSTRDLTIFEMAPAPYQKYSLAPTFEASSTNELHEKIETFCRELMVKINEPVKDCPHCEGRGVIINK